jgi:hypothetical protein
VTGRPPARGERNRFIWPAGPFYPRSKDSERRERGYALPDTEKDVFPRQGEFDWLNNHEGSKGIEQFCSDPANNESSIFSDQPVEGLKRRRVESKDEPLIASSRLPAQVLN